MQIFDRVASIILAGGQGVRLFPLTQIRCKPAVSFGGRYRLIDIPLSNSLHSRINKIFVISQYLASTVHQHIIETYQLAMLKTGTIELLSPEETSEKKVWYKENSGRGATKSLSYSKIPGRLLSHFIWRPAI